MGKRVSTRRIKKDRHYTYEMAADVLGLSPRTVMSWRNDGLQVMDTGRPHYVLGEALIEFCKKRQAQRSIGMAVDQMYCFRCREPRRPYGAMVDYVPINDVRGCLVSLCEECERPLGRFTQLVALPELSQFFDITTNTASQA